MSLPLFPSEPEFLPAVHPVYPDSMLAVHFDQPGGPENLYLKEVAKPSPGEGEVLLKVAASALNRADLLQVPKGSNDQYRVGSRAQSMSSVN